MKAASVLRPRFSQPCARPRRRVWKYNDPENFELKQALARHLGTAPANLAIGEGIDGLLGQIVRMVIEPGLPVVTSLGGYPTFNFHVVGHGGRLVTVPYVDDREDLDGLLAAVKRENAPLVYFANPDNPMGSWWDADSVVAFAKALPGDMPAGARRSLWRDRAGGHDPFDRIADRHAERDPHPHLLQSLRPGRVRASAMSSARREPRRPSTRSATISA